MCDYVMFQVDGLKLEQVILVIGQIRGLGIGRKYLATKANDWSGQGW